MAKSPQVILTDKSSPAYTVTSSDTVLAVVGYATKGPLNQIETVVSKKEFIEKFGPISDIAPWSSLAVYRAFNQGNKVLFYRVEDGTAIASETAILNAVSPATGYQEFTPTSPISGYIAKKIYDFSVNVDSIGTRDVFVTSPETGDWSLSSLASEINTQLSATAGFVEFTNITPSSIVDGDFVLNIDVDGAGASDETVALVSTDTLETIVTKLNAELSGCVASVNSITNKIRIYSSSTGTSSTIDIGTPGSGTDLITIIGAVETTADGSATTGASASVNSDSSKIRITSGNAVVSSSSVDITTSGTVNGTEDLVALIGVDSAVPFVAEVAESSTDNILIKAVEKGSAGNKISVVKSSRPNVLTNEIINKIDIYYEDDGENNLKETYDDVSMVIADSNFFVKLINADIINGGSKWVNFEYEANDASPINFPDGTYTLGTGTIEFTTGDLIGDYDYKVGTDGIPVDPQANNSSAFVSALGTDGDFANMEEYDYHILITPDNGSEVVQNTAIQLAEFRGDFFYIADTPKSVTYSQVIDWHNGKNGLGRDSLLNTEYAATYWSWLSDYDTFHNEYVWCPSSVFMAEKFMEIDRKYGPWFAAAGDVRGKLIAYDYEKSPSLTQRDLMYGDLNAVNPIVFFSDKGLEVYGNKTLLRETKAESRIHIVRMKIYVKKLIKKAMDGLIFEPHNPASWSSATNKINSILESIRQAGGLENYKVIIDSNTNTPDVIAQSIMKGVIELLPFGSIEIIKLDIKMNNPGAVIK